MLFVDMVFCLKVLPFFLLIYITDIQIVKMTMCSPAELKINNLADETHLMIDPLALF